MATIGGRLAPSFSVGARRYTELEVWQIADQFRIRTQELIGGVAFQHHKSLHAQLDRATRSACANIAEGFGRYQPKDFARFLRISKGSILEAREHLHHAHQMGLVTPEDLDAVTRLAARTTGAIVRLIRYLETAKAP